MTSPVIDINAFLRKRIYTLDNTAQKLKDMQIVEECQHASPRVVSRLRYCVDLLDCAVQQIEEANADY